MHTRTFQVRGITHGPYSQAFCCLLSAFTELELGVDPEGLSGGRSPGGRGKGSLFCCIILTNESAFVLKESSTSAPVDDLWKATSVHDHRSDLAADCRSCGPVAVFLDLQRRSLHLGPYRWTQDKVLKLAPANTSDRSGQIYSWPRSTFTSIREREAGWDDHNTVIKIHVECT